MGKKDFQNYDTSWYFILTMNNKNQKDEKELLFLNPIRPEISVDEIFNQQITVFKKKVSKFILTKHLTKEINYGQN